MSQEQSPDLTPVFRSSDPLEASAVAEELRSTGIPVVVVEDPRAAPSGDASREATFGGSVTATGARPTLVPAPRRERTA